MPGEIVSLLLIFPFKPLIASSPPPRLLSILLAAVSASFCVLCSEEALSLLFFLFSQLPSWRLVIVRFAVRLIEPSSVIAYKIYLQGWGRKCGKPALATTGSASTTLAPLRPGRYTHINFVIHGPNSVSADRRSCRLVAFCRISYRSFHLLATNSPLRARLPQPPYLRLFVTRSA